VLIACRHGSIGMCLMREHRHAQFDHALIKDLPALPESQSAVAVWVAKATVARVARENLIMKSSAGGMRQWLCRG
jgi:hypothetical protein